MSIVLRISLLIGILIYVIFIFSLLRKKNFTLKYSLLWFFSALVLFVFVIFPDVAIWISKILGIESVVNAVFLMFLFVMLLILVSLTSIVSKQHNSIKVLIQELAMAKKEIEEMKKK
ncbi:MAG: DUF2304 domain-containing protein [Clostridia bacterium]|nr:DUF2304 domain-containing protein [Clostridia bacterium]